MNLGDLHKKLISEYKFGQNEAVAAVEATAKMITFKYQAELYKVFSQEDIAKANELNQKEALAYLHKQYEAKTGEKADKLLDQITSEIVSEILKDPTKHFALKSAA